MTKETVDVELALDDKTIVQLSLSAHGTQNDTQ